jgi:hypothetical protein
VDDERAVVVPERRQLSVRMEIVARIVKDSLVGLGNFSRSIFNRLVGIGTIHAE